MKYRKLLLFAAIFGLLTIPSAGSAQVVEIFSAAIAGTKACGDLNVFKIKQTVFVRLTIDTVNNTATIEISLDQSFTDVLTLQMGAYQTSAKGFAFIASGEDIFQGHNTLELISGTGKIGPTGVTSFTGTFVEEDDANCFSSGTIKSVKRIS